ncbi:uncharacterized protein MEPE_00509 [Melanopsichium pennsylvanicum]|uniref:Wd40 repeat-like protein n=2 Tax=Melanopsichium pennsylvanicum TaxID=63383 RepID=A0AAJ4XG03_9BASI|nr:wd40 repeat-like protein [Melanopsichium pennsylvanicum 4]SNX81804.1 uncharacterized protein MEPE_00509 [Melanopsichium pennsylvanicum]
MTTAAPLSLPFVFRHNEPFTSTQPSRRRWKLDRPNYRALLTANQSTSATDGTSSSRLQNASIVSTSKLDPDQLEEDLEEWGLPASEASASSCGAFRLTSPTSAISWDENSAQSSCSYLQGRRPNGSAAAASLDQWDPSISFAPYASSGLEPIALESCDENKSAIRHSFKYDPGLGRVLAVGRDDGTISIYRAYGRTEDYEPASGVAKPSDKAEDRFPASVSTGANISQISTSASRRPSIVSESSRLRSPDIETPSIRVPSSAMSKSNSSSGREPSPLLPAFSHIDRSSLAARSTISAVSASSAVAANVQLDEGVPVNSLQSNVTATGHTAGRNFAEQAENRLEQQMAAAERNDHQHGVVGGVIERLGFASHSPSPSPHQNSPTHQNPRQSYHRARSSESRRSPVSPPLQRNSSVEAAAKALTPVASTLSDTSLRPSTSDAWLHDPTRGSFSHLMTLYTRDRSAVVALRLVPSSAAGDETKDAAASSASAVPTLDVATLLVVQEAGHVSMWSILEGTMLWQTDVSTAQVVVASESIESAVKDASASLGVMHTLSRQLPAAIGTPLSRSPAGSARASPRPTLSGGEAGMRHSMLRAALSAPDSTSNSRLCEAHGVKLDFSVQISQIHGSQIALLWDVHSSSLLMLDLADGRLLLREAVDDVHPANTPTLRQVANSSDRLELAWFSNTESKLHEHPLRILTTAATGSPATGDGPHLKAVQGIILDSTSEETLAKGEKWTLASDARPGRIYFCGSQIVVLAPARLSLVDATNGEIQFTQEATTDPFKTVCGSSRDLRQFFVQTMAGLGKFDLTTSGQNRIEDQRLEQESSTTSFSPIAVQSPARMQLCWNLPGSGNLLDKLFVLQPLPGTEKDESFGECELATLDLSILQTEILIEASKARSADAPASDKESTRSDHITALLPLSLEKIAVASSGGIRIFSLSSIAAGVTSKAALTQDAANSLGPAHEICLLRSAVTPRSGHRFIIGGTLQGEVGFWTAPAGTGKDSGSSPRPELEAAMSVSTTPVESLIVFGDDDNTIRLHGCVACVCADSSITVVLLEGFRQLYTIPGRGARVTSLAVRADELLLTYDDDKARVWDLRSQELRRSIATDQAQALIEDGKGWWTVKTIERYSPLHSGTTGVLSQLASARDNAAASLLVDFRRAIEAASRSVRGPSQPTPNDATLPRMGASPATMLQPPATLRSEQDLEHNTDISAVSIGSSAARKAVNIVRPLLPTVFPIGLDANADAKLAALLDLEEPDTSRDGGQSHSAFKVGLHSAPDALMVGASEVKGGLDADAQRAWKLSSRLTTMRVLVASALLRIVSKVSELEGLTEELRQFVEDEAQLSNLAGVGFRGVTLDELMPYWLDSNTELQSACRTMFQAALVRLDQAQIEEVCNQWQDLLAPAKTATETWKPRAVTKVTAPAGAGAIGEVELRTRAMALLGSMAIERYTSLSPKLLKEIASTIHSAIACDKGSEMRTRQETQTLAVAIELCHNGFSMWQHYFDATEVVRSLFALSTSTCGSSKSEGDLRSLARSATLQIAAENTPLFMTTLSLDILHARSAAHCAATMRLVAFMVRKRPSVLVANLPRVAEAVVKSLDPTHTTMREAVVNAATVMISELVSTYPSVSFFGGGQRLGVGTQEGAVIMYDLKTATRLYVLEGHRHRADAVSFSPDGRRLVTMSLEEGRVLVWKTSWGFSSFFSPGQMPRQGAADAKLTDGAYKAFLFNVGDLHRTASRPNSVLNPTAGVLLASSGGFAGDGQEEEFVGFDRIGFHWNSERSVKVQIGEAQLNISVE